MNLKMKWPLNSPEDSTGAPSGGAPSSGAASVPATVPAQVDLPALPASDAHESETAKGSESPNVEGDESSIDWHAESEPAADAPDDVVEGDEPPPAPPKPPAQQPPKPPAQPPAQKPPETPPEAPKPPEQQPPAAPKQPVAETPEQVQARELAEKTTREAAEKEQHAKLVEYYKIPDDMAARLATEPELVLPELAAKMHQAMLKSTMNMLAAELPHRLQMLNTYNEGEKKSSEAFYGKWPQLKGHEQQVLQVGRMYRQMNPKATPEQAIEKIGRVVIAALGLSEQSPASGQPPAPPPAKPSSFRPAGTSAAAAAATPPSENVFTQMAEAFLEEDRQA